MKTYLKFLFCVFWCEFISDPYCGNSIRGFDHRMRTLSTRTRKPISTVQYCILLNLHYVALPIFIYKFGKGKGKKRLIYKSNYQ